MMKKIKIGLLVFSLSVIAIVSLTRGSILLYPRNWFLINWRVLRNPEDEYALLQRSRMQDSVGNYRGAIADLEKIIRINPDDAASYERIARIYMWMEEFESSHDYFRKAESLFCSDAVSSSDCESVRSDIDSLLNEIND